MKNKHCIIGIYIIFLLCSAAKIVMADTGKEYIENIEIVESSITFDYDAHPVNAYLCMELKNNGDKNVSNLTFEVSYYDEGGYLIKKAVLKNALTEALPQGEDQKCKIRLKGDIVNIEHEQYPYSRSSNVHEFKVKITDVKLARK